MRRISQLVLGQFTDPGGYRGGGFAAGGFAGGGYGGKTKEAMLTFTRSAATGVSPLITAATAADADFIWTGPGGTFVGKQPNITNFPAGDFTLRSSKWDAVTQINFSTRLLTNALSTMINRVANRLTSLTVLYLYNNQLTGALSDVTLPASLTTLSLHTNQLTGALSAVTLPASLTILHLGTNQLTGALSDVTLPASLTVLHLYTNQLTGALSDVTLPASLTVLHLGTNQLTYPATSGSLAGLTTNNANYQFQDNAMIQAHVDNILADCVTSATTGSTLNVAGTNAAPTGGAANADYVTLGTRGWTVTIS